jgi:imidazolonepropionase-like amidohydrolase
MRGIALFLSGCLCWSAAFAAAPPVALVGGTVWTGAGAAIPNGVVVIEGDTILALGPMASTPVPDGAQIISTEGMTVLPGLVDLAVQSWRLGHGNPAKADPILRPLAARVVMPWTLGVQLTAGVTTVREVGAPAATALDLRRRVAEKRVPGPRLVVAAPVLERQGHPEPDATGRRTVQSVAEATAAMRQWLDDGADAFVVAAPEEWTPEELQSMVALAHAASRPVWAELRWASGVAPAMAAGMDGLLGLGLDTAPDWPPEALAAVQARVAAGQTVWWAPQLAPLATWRRWSVDAEPLDSPAVFQALPALLAQDLRASWTPYSLLAPPPYAQLRSQSAGARVRALRAAGARVVTGSAAGQPALPQALALHEEIFALVREADLTSEEALRAATVDAAAAVGRQGVLVPGGVADIIAVRGPVLEDIGLLREVALVFAAGRRMK